MRNTLSDIENALAGVARRLRAIAALIDVQCGEHLGEHGRDDGYASFQILLDAVRTEAARTEEQCDQLSAAARAA